MDNLRSAWQSKRVDRESAGQPPSGEENELIKVARKRAVSEQNMFITGPTTIDIKKCSIYWVGKR